MSEWQVVKSEAPDYTKIIEATGQRYKVDPELIRAVMLQESGGDPDAVGAETKWGRARGLMQLMPENVKRLGVKNPHSAKQSIDAGTRLLRELLDRYKGDVELTLKGYHGGTNQDNWGPKTAEYPQRVMGRMQMPPKPQAAPGEAQAPEWELVEVPAQAGEAPTEEAPPAAAPAAVPRERFARRPSPQNTGPTWTGSAEFANGSLFGQGPRIAAAASAAKQLFADPTKVQPIADAEGNPLAPGQVYDQTLARLRGDRKAYQEDNPMTSLALGMAGSLAPTSAVMGAVGRGAAVVGDLVGRVAPGIAPAIDAAGRVLGGTAGYTAGGRAMPGIANALIRPVAKVAAGAVQGAGASVLNADMADAPIGEQVAQGALTGGALGAAGYAARGVINALRGAPVDRDVATLAQWGMDRGMTPRAAQVSDSTLGKGIDAVMEAVPFTGRVNAEAGRRAAFTRTAADMIGADGKLNQRTYATAMQQVKQLGDNFANELINFRTIPIKTFQEVDNLIAKMPVDDRNTVIGLRDAIMDKMVSGKPVTGQEFQMMTNWGSELGKAGRMGTPNVKLAAGKLRAGLFNALDNSLSPESAANYRKFLEQWRVGLALKKLVQNAGPDGIIDPTALMAQVAKVDKKLMMEGGGELGKLAMYGQEFFERGGGHTDAGNRLLKGVIGLGGAAAGGGMLGVPFAGAPAAVGLAAATRALSAANYAGAPGLIREALTGQPSAMGVAMNAADKIAPRLTTQTINMLKNY